MGGAGFQGGAGGGAAGGGGGGEAGGVNDSVFYAVPLACGNTNFINHFYI
jgi:hypothetical protein